MSLALACACQEAPQGPQLGNFRPGISVDPAASKVVVLSPALSPGGRTQVQIFLADRHGQRFVGSDLAVAVQVGDGGQVTVVEPPARQADGSYLATLEAERAGEVVGLSVVVDGVALGEGISLAVAEPVASSTWSEVVAEPSELRSGDNGTVTVTLRNEHGRVVAQPGGTLTLAAAGGGSGLSFAPYEAQADGSLRSLMTGGRAGSASQVVAHLDGAALAPATGLPSVTVVPGAVDRLEALDGDGQEGVLGTQVAGPLVLAAKDAAGNPVAGQALAWSTSGPLVLGAHDGHSDGQGQAQARCSWAGRAGVGWATATAVDGAGVALPGVLTARWQLRSLAVARQQVAQATVTVAGPAVADGRMAAVVRVVLEDATGAGVAEVVPELTVSGRGNALAACSPSDAGGRSACALTSTVAEAKTVALATPIRAGSAVAAFVPGPPDPRTSRWQVTAGPTLADDLAAAAWTLEVRDERGNPVPELPAGSLVVACQQAGCTAGGPLADSDAQGMMYGTVRSQVAGTMALAVTSPARLAGLAPAQVPFAAWRAVSLRWQSSPAAALAGAALSPLEVWLLDGEGRVVALGVDSTQAVSLAAADGALPLAGVLTRGAEAGRAQFAGGGVHSDAAGAGRVLRAQAALPAAPAGTATADSPAFAVLPGPAARPVFLSPLQPAAAGLAWGAAVEVGLEDVLGNPVTLGPDARATVSLSLRDGLGNLSPLSLAGGAARAMSAGRASFAGVTVGGSGTDLALRATAALAGGPAVGVDSPVAVPVGPAAALIWSWPDVGEVRSGLPWPRGPEVQLVNAAGELVASGPDASALVTLSVEGGGATLSGAAPAQAQAAGGVASFAGLDLRLSGHGQAVLRAEKAATFGPWGSGVLAVDADPVAVTFGAAQSLSWSPAPGAQVAGVEWAGPVGVEVLDGAGNRVASGADAAAPIALTASAGALAGTRLVAASGGVASFPGLSTERSGVLTVQAEKADTTGQGGSGALRQTSPAFTVSPGPAAALRVVAGPSSAVAGAAWQPAPVVQVVDRWGNAVSEGPDAGATVTLTAAPGCGPLSGLLSAAAQAGVAAFPGVVLTQAGSGQPWQATATLDGSDRQVLGPAVAVAAGAGDHLRFVAEPGDAVAGQAWPAPPRLQVEDAWDNPVPSGGDAGAVVALAMLPGAGPLLGSTARPAYGGLVDFAGADLRLAAAGSGRQVRASATLSARAATADSAPFTVQPGAAQELRFAVAPADVVSGQSWPAPPAVQVVDTAGNPVTAGADAAAEVTLTLLPPPGVAAAPLSGTTTVAAAAGVTSFPDAMALVVGSGWRLRASATLGGVGASVEGTSFSVAPGVADHLVWRVGPPMPPDAPVVSQAVGSPAPEVCLADAAGNRVTAGADAAAPIALALAQGTGILSGATTQPAVAGCAGFASSGLSLDLAGADKVLRASKPDLSAAGGGGALTLDSAAFAVVAGPAAQLQLVAGPGAGVAGAALSPQPSVQVADAAGNPVVEGPDAAVTLQAGWSLAEGPLDGTLDASASSGRASWVDLGGRQAGGHQLVLAKPDTSGQLLSDHRGSPALSVTCPSFVLSATAASRLSWASQPPAQVTAGVALPADLAVQVADGFGNLVVDSSDAGATVALSLVAGGPLVGPASRAASGGVATFPGLSLTQAGGGQALRADATLAGAACSATSLAFAVAPGAATSLRFDQQPAAATAGLALTPAPRLAVLDDWSNLVVVGADAVLDVALTLSGGPLSGRATLPAVAGVADYAGAGLRPVARGTGQVLAAHATTSAGLALATSSATFDVAPAAAARLAFTAQPSGGAATLPWPGQPVVEVQDALGNLVEDGPDAAATVSLSPWPGGPLAGTTSASASGGTASFAGLSQPTVGSGQRLRASASLAGNSVQVVSEPYSIAAGAADHLVLTRAPSSQVVSGEPWPIAPQLSLVDAAGNPIMAGPDASATLSLSLIAGAGTLGGTTSLAMVGGTADLAGQPLTLDLAGSGQVVRVAKGDTRASPGGSAAMVLDLPAMAVMHGDAAQLVLTQAPAAATAGVPLSPAVVAELYDAAGNLVDSGVDAGAVVTVAQLGGTLAGGPQQVALSGGTASLAGLQIYASGPQVLRVSKADTVATLDPESGRRGSGPLQVDSAPIAVSPAAGAQLAWRPQPGGGVAGVPWAQQPAVQVLDAFANLVTDGSDAGATVTLEAAPGAAALAPQAVASQVAAAGTAGFAGLYTTGPGAALQLVARATLSGQPASLASAPFAVVAGPGTQLAFAVQPGGGAAAAPWPQQPVVRILDAFGNLSAAPADTGATVTLTLVGGSGALSGSTSRSAVGAVADFAAAGLSLDLPGAGKQLQAAATLSAGGPQTLASDPFQVSPAGPVQLAFTQQPSGGVAGAAWPSQPQVELRDGLGQRLVSGLDSNITVNLAPAAGLGALMGGTGQVAVAGVASFAGLSCSAAGSGALVATATTSSGQVAASSASLTVAPAAASALAFVPGPPDSVTAGAPWPRAPQVVLLDGLGNPVTVGADAGAGVALSLAAGAGPLTGAPLSVAAVAGRADFSGSGLRLAGAGPGQVLRASKADTTASGGSVALMVDAPALEVLPGQAAGLAFVQQPGGGSAGSAWAQQPQVELLDGQGNRVTGGPDSTAMVTLQPAAGEGPLAGTASVQASAGLASFAGLGIDRAGVHTLVASKADTTGMVALGTRGTPPVAQTSAPVPVVAGPASVLAFAPGPGGGAAGATWATQPRVEVRDAYGNRVLAGADGGATVALSLSAGPGTLSGPSTLGAAAGVAAFAGLSLDRTSPTAQLSATATLAGVSRQASSPPFAVVPAAAAELAMTTAPGGGVAGAAWAQQPLVEVRDLEGNRVTQGGDASQVVTLALSAGSGILSGATSRRATQGVADFSGAGLSVDRAGSDKVLSASAALSGPGPVSVTSPSFTVAYAAASRLAFVAQPGGGPAHAAWAGQPEVAVLDAFGNTVTGGADAGATITLGHPRGVGALQGTASLAASSGVASFAGLYLDAADANHQLSAAKSDTSAGGGTPAIAAGLALSAPFVVSPAPASRLVWLRQPGDAQAGAPLGGQPLTVELQDAYGNRATEGADAAATVTLSRAAGTGTLSGVTSGAASGGVASFSGLSIAQIGSKTLIAQAGPSGGPASATSAGFAIAPAVASTLLFGVQPGGGVSRATWATQPQVQVQDAWGNPIASGDGAAAQVALSLGSGSGVLSGGTTQAASAGSASFTGLSIDVPGSKKVTASAMLPGGTTSKTSDAFSIDASTAFTQSWPMDPGTQSSYTLEPNLSFAGGTVSLAASDQSDTTQAELNLGTASGVAYDSNGAFLRLGNAGGCDGMANNCSSLDSSWTPQWGSLLGYYTFDGAGPLPTKLYLPQLWARH